MQGCLQLLHLRVIFLHFLISISLFSVIILSMSYFAFDSYIHRKKRSQQPLGMDANESPWEASVSINVCILANV